MNSFRLTGKVRVKGADDYTGMCVAVLMKLDEMAPVEGEHCPVVSSGECEYFRIGNRLPGIACLGSREHAMPQTAQL